MSDVEAYKCTLSEEVLNKAKKELNEDPKTRNVEVQTLRERLLRYPGLNPRVDTEFLLKFLRSQEFDQEPTFKLMLNYYMTKENNQSIFAELTPKSIKHFLDAEIIHMIPRAGKNGETVIIFKIERWNPDQITMDDVFKGHFLYLSAITECEEAQVHGIRLIYDLEGLTWSHCMALTPSKALRLTSLLQDTFPVRVHGIHHVNESSILETLMAISKPFLNDKLSKRLHFHGKKIKELHAFIHDKYLPTEYGGSADSLSAKASNQQLFEKQSNFENDAKYGFVPLTIQQQAC